MKRILDGLDAIEASVPEIKGRLDRSRLAVAGHSMGGHTAGMLLGAQLTGEDGTKVDLAARALNAIIRDLMDTRDGATYFAGRVWRVHTHYDLGNGHPLVGRSVPNFEFEDGARIGELMHAGQAILLDFDRNASLKSLASKYGERIQYVSGLANEPLGLSAALIRPDGIIGWASDNDPDCNELQKAAAHWFMTEPV